MEAHLGMILKNILFEKRINPVQMAKQIGVTPTTVRSMFKRKYIRPDLLEKVSKALNHDFFQYAYPSLQQPLSIEVAQLKKEMEELKKENEELKKENTYLKEINILLKKNNK